ncbi:unnamed protein product [Lepeophtheirus salmonis]|uniref:(salmon louse) hypothetical protein n=1 Tax=Lepeophtheirus salmonis TaxID=72036 RepID=A0A7R8H0R4_LEPSM|nr:unnamed protein product [Lepeophtheirus salmonis]CAF2774181.1 unnamed protein product [Lepeophtheirus salmonis]
MNLRFYSCGLLFIYLWICVILSSSSGVELLDSTTSHLSLSPVPLIRKIPMMDDLDVSNDIMEEPSLLNEEQVSSYNQSKKNDTLSKKVPLRADDGNCDRDLCHFTGRIRSSRHDISSLLRGIHVEVSYLDITRIMSPFKTHVTVDFDVSFNQVQDVSSVDNLTKAFNKELFIGTNLGPYTLDPDETQFLLYNQQPYNDQRVHHHGFYPFLSLPSKIVENNYLLAGGVLSLISLIVFLGLGIYFQSKRTNKKSVNSVTRRDKIYSRTHRQHPNFVRYSEHDLSFFERLKIEDSEKFLMHSDSGSTTCSRNNSIGESSSLRFDDVHRSTLKSNASSCNSSTRRKLDTIKEKESLAIFEMEEMHKVEIKKPCLHSIKSPELESQYDVIEKL